jgi:hypothetical protein
MNEELTRVFEKYELEAMIEYYKNNDCSRRVAIELATALLEERAKPNVWDGAPEWAKVALVGWYENNEQKQTLCCKCYTRELPKTRARQIAEKIVHGIRVRSPRPSAAVDIEYVEKILNKYAEELEGKS